MRTSHPPVIPHSGYTANHKPSAVKMNDQGYKFTWEGHRTLGSSPEDGHKVEELFSLEKAVCRPHLKGPRGKPKDSSSRTVVTSQGVTGTSWKKGNLG